MIQAIEWAIANKAAYNIKIINLSIGLYHPPVGTTLFITSSIAQVKMGEVVKELIPFYFVAIGILMLFAFVPAMTIRM